MKNQNPTTLKTTHFSTQTQARLNEAMAEYSAWRKQEEEMIAAGEPIFRIPEPSARQIEIQQRREARARRMAQLPTFYIPEDVMRRWREKTAQCAV